MAKLSKALNSTAISMVEYDDQSQELDVTFSNGRTYTHYRVPKSEYDALTTAGSAGSYYAANIRGKFA